MDGEQRANVENAPAKGRARAEGKLQAGSSICEGRIIALEASEFSAHYCQSQLGIRKILRLFS